MTIHLTEEELQQYALEGVETVNAGHLKSCETCQAKLAAYKLLFKGIQEEPAPAFDFDLASLVMAQLPSPKAARASGNTLIYLLVLLAVLLTGTALYLLRSYLSGFFDGIAPLIIYLAVATLVPLSIVLCVDMYKTYNKKMLSLDFS